jgi:hypothetical protein
MILLYISQPSLFHLLPISYTAQFSLPADYPRAPDHKNIGSKVRKECPGILRNGQILCSDSIPPPDMLHETVLHLLRYNHRNCKILYTHTPHIEDHNVYQSF